jgi:hypothetical protein
VNALCRKRGRKVVVVDGVGFPAVGSIVGMSNAVLARAPVVLVCPRGVGNAVDSFNLARALEAPRVCKKIFKPFPLLSLCYKIQGAAGVRKPRMKSVHSLV